jgi:phosphoribosylanthranilate isomerase
MVDAAAGAGAAAIGFVSFPPSPRHLAPDAIAPLAARVPAGILKVAVLVTPDDALVAAVLAAGCDVLQVHGASPERLASLKGRASQLWAAVGVRTRADIAGAANAAGPADLLLLDAKAPNEAPLPGGNGLSFDWRLLADGAPARRWGLAGGLDPDNVASALAVAHPALVDVSSGVEEGPGVKTLAKIRAFAAAVRGAA